MSLRKPYKLSMSMTRARSFAIAIMVSLITIALVGSCSGILKPEADRAEPMEHVTSESLEATATAEAEDPQGGSVAPGRPIPLPDRPEGLEGTDAVGAILSAEYFLDVYEYASRNGDTDEYKKLFTDDCLFCTETLSDIEELASDGLVVITGGIERSEGEIDPASVGKSEMSVYFDFTQKSSVVVDSQGVVISEYAAGKSDLAIRVEFIDGTWLVKAVSGRGK